MNAVKTRKPS